MEIALVCNEAAGSGHDAEQLVRLLKNAGHTVRYRPSKGWKSLLRKPTDLLVAAGGDGTVGRAILAAADHGVPFAAIPIGTANNIGKTLGVIGDARELAQQWSASKRALQPFDVGAVVAPWGHYRFVEAMGGGPIATLIRRGMEVEAGTPLLGRETDRALHLLRGIVREAPQHYWQITADGADLSGDYLAVEVMNIRFVGPNLPLAPDADPGDGKLDVVLVRAADREPLLAYLESRLHLASGQLPHLKVVRAERIELVAPAGLHHHLDDAVWPTNDPLADAAPLSVSCLAGAARFVLAEG